ERALRIAISTPTTMNGTTLSVASSDCDAVVPADQPRSFSSTCEFVSNTAEEKPDNTAPSATPERVIRTGFPRAAPVLPIMNTITEVTIAPANDHHMYCEMLVSPKNAKPTTTARDAPAFTPRIPGSVMGLRVTACI